MFVKETLNNKIGLKMSYVIRLSAFGLSMMISVLFPNVYVVNVCNAVSGLGTAVATSVPSTLVTMYQSDPDVFYPDVSCRKGTAYNMSIM